MPIFDMDNEAAWFVGVTARADTFKRELSMAVRNLAAAKAKDRLRYAYTKGGSYTPKPKQYEVGDFVYVKRRATNTLTDARVR